MRLRTAAAAILVTCLAFVGAAPAVAQGGTPTAPPAPVNLRVERDAAGLIQTFRWDRPPGHEGHLHYHLWMESQPEFFSAAAVEGTSELFVPAHRTPACDGCEYAPEQTITVWVVARGPGNLDSPPSDRIVLACCPF